MTVLSSIDILDEPDALSEDSDCDHYSCGCSYQRGADGRGARRFRVTCPRCYDPSPLCNCGTCPDGGPFTCVRED